MGHHAVERRQILKYGPPFPGVGADTNPGSGAHGEGIRAAEGFPGPLALDLYFRIAREGRGGWVRQSEIDGVAIVVAGKAELQADGGFSNRSLDRLFASLHGARERFGTGPERGMKAAFGSQRLNDAALGDVRQQSEGAIQAGLAAAVGAGDHIEGVEREPDVAQ
jgi:hypothetical protein